MFAYLGFFGVLRSRIQAAPAPTGFTPTHWNTIQNNVRKAETWDKSVYEATQQQQPGQIFVVASDLRSQILYWKDRRNDCAHSKQNKIVGAHVEAFYAFVESNLSKFAVNGSRPAMTARILNHYNPSLTAPNQPVDLLVQEITHAVPQNELDDFITELSNEFDNRRNSVELFLHQESENKIHFLSGCVRFGTVELNNACVRYLVSSDVVLLAYLRQNHSDIPILQSHPQKVRQLWHDYLFAGAEDDFPILGALLRHNLIPQDQLLEALQHIANKEIGHIPNELDNATLVQHGFYAALEQVMISPNALNSFDWANGCKALIVKYLADHTISRSVAFAIFQTFNSPYYPWHLRTYLNEFFQNNPAKKREFEGHLGGDPPVGRPVHLSSLAVAPPPNAT